MPLLLALLFACAALPLWTPLSATTALLAQAATAAAFLPFLWIWGKGKRLQTLPPLLATGVGAVGLLGALGMVGAAAGLAAGRIGPPRPGQVAFASALGVLGICAVLLPNTLLPPTAGAGLATFLLVAALRGSAGLLAATLAGAGVGLAWGLVGQGVAPVAAALVVAATLTQLPPGWRLAGLGCGALVVGALCGMLLGVATDTDPLRLLVVGAVATVVAFLAPPAGRVPLALLTALAAGAPPMGALWVAPALALAGSWGGTLRPVLGTYLPPEGEGGGRTTDGGATDGGKRREPIPPRPLAAAPTHPFPATPALRGADLAEGGL
jgi:hypothetical protein